MSDDKPEPKNEGDDTVGGAEQRSGGGTNPGGGRKP